MVWLGMTATTAWFVFMTWLSHQSGEKTSRASRMLAEDLGKLLPSEDPERLNALLRKTAHVVVFAVLAVLSLLTWQAAGKRPAGYGIWAALLLWCLGDEATKRMVPGRHFSWLDTGLNVLGVLVGGAVCAAW